MKKYLTCIKNFSNKNILVIGDIGLDSYVSGDVNKISPEAPVPVVEVKKYYDRLGLSANVASNVKTLGSNCDLVSLVGNDDRAFIIRKKLKNLNISSDYLVVDLNRPTTHKTRVMASCLHHVVRIDNESIEETKEDIVLKIIEQVEKLIKKSDLVVLEDYGKGFFSKNLTRKLIELIKENGKQIFVDPSRYTPCEYYKDADLLKPNLKEMEILSGKKIKNQSDIVDAGKSLIEKLNLKYLVVTRGKDGMSVFYDDEVKHIPSYPIDVFDVSGAGDTAIATLSLAFSSGLDMEEACILANAASSLVVSKVGTSSIDSKELISFIKKHIK
jgi:D-glycero-beta-D-manno-heptose-7-phosphate kinase